MVQEKKDSIELYNYLNKVFEDRIFIFVKKGYKDFFYITGYFDNIPISLEIDKFNDALIMDFNCSNSTLLKELIDVVSNYVGRRNPTFKYNYREKGNSIVTTIEWNKDFDHYIRRGKDVEVSSLYDFVNIKSFNETIDEREKRLGFTDLSGVFFPNGSLDDLEELEKMVADYNEADAYLALNSLLSVYFQLQVGLRNDLTYGECNLAMAIILRKIGEFFQFTYNEPLDVFYSDEYYHWSRKWKDFFIYPKKCEYMEFKLSENDKRCFDKINCKCLNYNKRGF